MQWTQQRSLTNWVCTPCAIATGTSRRRVPPAGTVSTRASTGYLTSSRPINESCRASLFTVPCIPLHCCLILPFSFVPFPLSSVPFIKCWDFILTSLFHYCHHLLFYYYYYFVASLSELTFYHLILSSYFTGKPGLRIWFLHFTCDPLGKVEGRGEEKTLTTHFLNSWPWSHLLVFTFCMLAHFACQFDSKSLTRFPTEDWLVFGFLPHPLYIPSRHWKSIVLWYWLVSGVHGDWRVVCVQGLISALTF